MTGVDVAVFPAEHRCQFLCLPNDCKFVMSPSEIIILPSQLVFQNKTFVIHFAASTILFTSLAVFFLFRPVYFSSNTYFVRVLSASSGSSEVKMVIPLAPMEQDSYGKVMEF